MKKSTKSINNAGLGPISKGTVCYNVRVENRPKTGRPCNKRTLQMIKNTREKIRRSVKRSMRKLAHEADMSPRSMRRLVNEDLRMRLVQNPIEILTASNLPSRLHGMILIQKWSVPAAGMHTREWRLWWRLMEDVLKINNFSR